VTGAGAADRLDADRSARGPRVTSELIAAHTYRGKVLRDQAMQAALLATLRGSARLARRAFRSLRWRRANPQRGRAA
jgi:hypothetical protein